MTPEQQPGLPLDPTGQSPQPGLRGVPGVPATLEAPVGSPANPHSLTASPLEPHHAFQAAVVQSATCPVCGRLSTEIQWLAQPAGRGVAYAAHCMCPNRHVWPFIEVVP